MRSILMASKKKADASFGGGTGGTGGTGGGGTTATFNPAPGTYTRDDGGSGSVSFQITASQSVAWSWSTTGNVPNSNVTNGGSAASITFTLVGGAKDKSCTITLTVGTNHWTINLSAAATASG